MNTRAQVNRKGRIVLMSLAMRFGGFAIFAWIALMVARYLWIH